MGSKSKGKHYTSKGERNSVNKTVLNSIRRERDPAEKWINIQKAWLKGQNPWITVANPNKEETKKKFIRVRANDVLGNPKEREQKMFRMTGE